MSILVTASRLSKSFAARPLFDQLTFTIESGDRIGLIGPNGAGKSTLLRILASQIPPDQGTLSFQRGVRIGFLEQTPQFKKDATILSTLLEGSMTSNSDRIVPELISRFTFEDPLATIASLSGGWKKRAALARELAYQPDLLLLDEPTNHLDLEGILWLEEFLEASHIATVTITHDRAFLQNISNRILELDRRNQTGLLQVKGDYATYLEIKEQLMGAQEQREIVLKNTLRRETEWLRQGAKARTTKQQARIHRAELLSSEVQELKDRNQNRTIQMDFQSSDKKSKKLIEAQEICMSYGSKKIFSGVNLLLTPGKRVAILGPNGCGKSTLVRVLTGLEPPQSGRVTLSENLSIAYFEQNRETLDPSATVLKTLCPYGDQVHYCGRPIHIRSYLDRFLFTPGQMEMKVEKLSGGEQSRLLIAQLMLNAANLLVLDEPTNDLDRTTLSVLQECLTDFPGAILLVTHDRYFLDQVATEILAFGLEQSHSKNLISFASLSQWETWHANQLKKNKTSVKKNQKINTKTEPTTSSLKKKKLTFKETKELETIEERIRTTEKLLIQFTHESTLEETSKNSDRLIAVTQEMNRLQAEIDHLYSRWSELELASS